MEKNKFKVGDIVRYYGDSNNKYRILEIKEDETLATESLISGNKYFFQQSQVEPAEKECPRKRLVKDMNDEIIKLGDIVRIHDGKERYKVTEINPKEMLVRLSTMDGEDKGVYGCGVFAKVKDLDEPMSKSDVPSYDGFSLAVGDTVKIHGDASGGIYYITELNLVNRDWYAKLKDKDDYNHGFFNTSELELVTNRWFKMGDYVKYHNAGDVVYMVMEVISKDQVRAYRVNDGNVMDIFSLELEKASAEELIRANGEYINSVLDMELARRQGAGCGKDGSGKDDRADHKPRWELLPLDAIEEIVKVYTMGAEKYADDAWKTIPDAHRRYLAALFRHVAAYERGERLDKESGLSHLAHAAWNAIAILWLDMNNKEVK